MTWFPIWIRRLGAAGATANAAAACTMRAETERCLDARLESLRPVRAAAGRGRDQAA